MNIKDYISFNSEKPAVHVVRDTEHSKVIAIGLEKDQLLSKHTTNKPTLLTVLQGELTFTIDEHEHQLTRFDTYEIPVGIEHEVLGMEEENIFILFQEK